MSQAATQDARRVKASSLPVAEIMDTKVGSIEPNATASFAWSRMKSRGTDHLIVMEDGEARGILSARDLGGAGGARLRSGRVVRDLMISDAVNVGPNTTLRDAVNLMLDRQIGSLPVFDDGRPVGIVKATDVLDALGRDASREPFPGWLPKAVKRDGSRRKAALVPAHIRVSGSNLGKAQGEEIRRKLGARFGKFADAIERVTVRVKDVNGPRGGIDQVCAIKVVLSDLPSIVFESQHHSVNGAVGAAITGTERAVRRRLQRRRTKPRKNAAPVHAARGSNR